MMRIICISMWTTVGQHPKHTNMCLLLFLAISSKYEGRRENEKIRDLDGEKEWKGQGMEVEWM